MSAEQMNTKTRVLIADDHSMVLEVLSLFLSSQPDLEVLSAGDLDGALKVIADVGPVDVTLLDLNMPGMNGLEGLRRALDAAPEDRDSLDQAIKNVLDGVEMTEKEFLGAFEKHGIKKIDPMGEKFDYNFHQAMMEVDDPSCPPGTVVQVLAPGYVLHDRLLRAAMVGVSKGGAPENHESIDTTA